MANPLIVGGLVDLLSKGIDRIFPDKNERERAKLALFHAQQEGALKELEISMSAIVAEANSADPWTSRARPSFLYVAYTLLIFSIPMGFLHAFAPETAGAAVEGFKAWLDAIPEPIITLMGVGYLGYAGARSYDKRIPPK